MFVCMKCGECCRHIDKIPQLSEFDLGNGVCMHLKGNCCDIYSSRPEICRVDEMYDKYFCNIYSREEFYKINMNICRKLIGIKGKNEEKICNKNQRKY